MPGTVCLRRVAEDLIRAIDRTEEEGGLPTNTEMFLYGEVDKIIHRLYLISVTRGQEANLSWGSFSC